MFDHILPLYRKIAQMVKNSIQHDFHPTFMRLIDQTLKGLFVPKMRIDRKIIDRVIFMVGMRRKDRTQI